MGIEKSFVGKAQAGKQMVITAVDYKNKELSVDCERQSFTMGYKNFLNKNFVYHLGADTDKWVGAIITFNYEPYFDGKETKEARVIKTCNAGVLFG